MEGRRRSYQITVRGQLLLEEEAQRLEEQLRCYRTYGKEAQP